MRGAGGRERGAGGGWGLGAHLNRDENSLEGL